MYKYIYTWKCINIVSQFIHTTYDRVQTDLGCPGPPCEAPMGGNRVFEAICLSFFSSFFLNLQSGGRAAWKVIENLKTVSKTGWDLCFSKLLQFNIVSVKFFLKPQVWHKSFIALHFKTFMDTCCNSCLMTWHELSLVLVLDFWDAVDKY